jgi:NDP-sugar pyrophosphorylase family protein
MVLSCARTGVMRSFLAAALLLASVPAFAEDTCTIDAGPKDVVKKKGDIVIEAGQSVEDVITLDGNVTLKAGSTVKSAVSLHGNVIIEIGAKVEKSALAIGGRVQVEKGAKVKNVIEISDKGLKVRGDDGDDVDVNINIGGKSLGQMIADEALAKTKNCKVAISK